MMNIADNAMSEQSDILNTIKQKMIQAGTDTTSEAGRESILKDVQKLMTQFNNIAESTNYNGTNLLQQSETDTSASDSLTFQTGTDSSSTTTSDGVQANSTGMGLDSLLTETIGTFSASSARNYLTSIDTAIDTLNGYRSDIGSTTNQLISTTKNLLSQQSATEAAKSVILDTDYAKESANFSSQNVISQAGAHSISQANAIQGNVLRLLQ